MQSSNVANHLKMKFQPQDMAHSKRRTCLSSQMQVSKRHGGRCLQTKPDDACRWVRTNSINFTWCRVTVHGSYLTCARRGFQNQSSLCALMTLIFPSSFAVDTSLVDHAIRRGKQKMVCVQLQQPRYQTVLEGRGDMCLLRGPSELRVNKDSNLSGVTGSGLLRPKLSP